MSQQRDRYNRMQSYSHKEYADSPEVRRNKRFKIQVSPKPKLPINANYPMVKSKIAGVFQGKERIERKVSPEELEQLR